MADEAWLMTIEQALAALPDGDRVHTFMDGGMALLGADWDRDDIVNAISKATERRITGPQAQGGKHGLAIPHPRAEAWLYIETRARTDIAEVTDD